MSKKKGQVNVDRSLLEGWQRTADDLRRSLEWLRRDRERLVILLSEYERGAAEMNSAGKRLMEMYEDLRRENERLLAVVRDGSRPRYVTLN